MRNRSGQIDLESASEADLDAELSRLSARLQLAPTRQQEKAFFARLIELDEVLTRRFQRAPAKRALRARQDR